MAKGLVLWIVILCTPWAGAALAQAKPGEDGVRGVATVTIRGKVAARGESADVSGRLSFSLAAQERELREGKVRIENFNLALFEVPQQLLAGELAGREERGVLGFALDPRKAQYLRYDAKGHRLEGELRGRIDAGYMARLRTDASADAPGDIVETPIQEATVRVRMTLEGALRAASVAGDKPERLGAEVSLSLEADETRYPKFVLPAVKLELEHVVGVGIDVGPLRLWEPARELCVQPVRLERCWFLFWWFRSGAGLAFGQPGAKTQWDKADVVFDYRPWKNVHDSDYWELSEDEEDAFRGEVEDADCIEVFFSNSFDPDDNHGGGVTFGAGTAGSQIISSDANARNGVDFTHLAHELGHVLGLRHPDAAATASAVPGSTGTLICPSGFNNDNPKINSEENEDLLSNPLLTFTLKRISPAPDCDDSADCGRCP
jgi:hypothetical protein